MPRWILGRSGNVTPLLHDGGMVETSTSNDWLRRFDALICDLDELTTGQVQRLCDVGRSKLEAVEVRRLAAEVGADGDSSRARKMAARGGRRSKAAARRAAARAKAVSKNPGLADDLNTGALTDEKLDAIADAMSDDESAATDADFVDAIKAAPVDQARRLAQKRKQQSSRDASAHAKQRRLRSARRWKDHDAGLSVLQLAGDDATIEELWNLITARQEQLKEADGGRDLPASQHPRTFDQRLFDAAADLLRGVGGVGRSRPSLVVLVPVDGSGATVAGGGPLPDHAVADLLARSDLSVQLTDQVTGQPLWHGRLKRNATTAQFLALVVRDQGCVRCGASWARCHAHHLLPWHAPGAGTTDIDGLALLCPGCHHDLHAENLTLVADPATGTWTTRPATPVETPPPRPSSEREPRVKARPVRAQTSGPATRKGDRRAVSDSEHPGLFPRPGSGATYSRPAAGEDDAADAADVDGAAA